MKRSSFCWTPPPLAPGARAAAGLFAPPLPPPPTLATDRPPASARDARRPPGESGGGRENSGGGGGGGGGGEKKKIRAAITSPLPTRPPSAAPRPPDASTPTVAASAAAKAMAARRCGRRAASTGSASTSAARARLNAFPPVTGGGGGGTRSKDRARDTLDASPARRRAGEGDRASMCVDMLVVSFPAQMFFFVSFGTLSARSPKPTALHSDGRLSLFFSISAAPTLSNGHHLHGRPGAHDGPPGEPVTGRAKRMRGAVRLGTAIGTRRRSLLVARNAPRARPHKINPTQPGPRVRRARRLGRDRAARLAGPRRAAGGLQAAGPGQGKEKKMWGRGRERGAAAAAAGGGRRALSFFAGRAHQGMRLPG
jgi:hypothetical protein